MNRIQFENKEIYFIGLVALVLIWFVLIGRPWLKALLSGIRIKQIEILFMRIRNTPVNLIITELIKATKSGISISRSDLEICHLGGGNITNVVTGLIFSKASGNELSLEDAKKLDLQKYDIVTYLKNRQI